MADPANDSSLSSSPIVFVAIPLAGILLVGALAGLYTCRRRRRLQQDPERAAGGGSTSVYVGRTAGGRVIIGDAWGGGATGRRPARTTAAAGVNRREEGLNELGEAPPPYDGAKDGDGDDAEGGTELRDMPRRAIAAEQGAPPGYDAARAGEADGASGTTAPPATGSADSVAPPPAAVVAGRDRA